MTVEEALSYIHRTKWQGTKPGLERTERLLSYLGDPHKDLKFVHVAGTNGKGSTCAMIASILRQSGLRTGLYTSPYIRVFNERMQVNGAMISDEELVAITEEMMPYAEKMRDDSPTEFEWITAAAMLYFKRRACDIVVLEVGMGGELDSTNVIAPPECAVICAIGLDHTAYLGDTVEKIAHAKAGIIKNGTPTVMYPAERGVTEVIETACATHGSRLTSPDFSALRIKEATIDGIVFDYKNLHDLHLPLVGTYQPYNAAMAIETAKVLSERGYPIDENTIRKGIAAVTWQGRFEILRKDPVFILDGSHNPHGMQATVASFGEYFGTRKIHFVIGAMADKDVTQMLSLLLPHAERFYTVTAPNPRAMQAETLAETIRSCGAKAQAFSDIGTAVSAAIENAGRDGICAALGTLYFSADVRNAVCGISFTDENT